MYAETRRNIEDSTRTAPVREGEVLDLRTETTAPEGDGVGFVDGMAVIVEGAPEGEVVRVRIKHVCDTYAVGTRVGTWILRTTPTNEEAVA